MKAEPRRMRGRARTTAGQDRVTCTAEEVAEVSDSGRVKECRSSGYNFRQRHMRSMSSASLLSACGPFRRCQRSMMASPLRFTKISKEDVSSELSFSDSEDETDDDDASSMFSSCDSSASDQSLLSCAASQLSSPAQPKTDEVSSGRSAGRQAGPSACLSHPDIIDAQGAPGLQDDAGVTQRAQEMWLKELTELKVPITHDLDEALRSNGQLAYVPSSSATTSLLATHPPSMTISGVHPAQHQQASPASSAVPLMTQLPKLAGCPCPMCLQPQVRPASTEQICVPAAPCPGQTIFALPQPEVANFSAPVPSSLAIAAALASGQLSYPAKLERPTLLERHMPMLAPDQAAAHLQQQPPPASHAAALLMARSGNLLPTGAAVRGQPLLGRPLGLPLSSPALVEPGVVWH